MRKLNEHELNIIKTKEERNGKKYNVQFIEYRKLFPRFTLCILSNVQYPTTDKVTFGATLRGKNDMECDAVGEVQSFIRALNSM